ncbi:ATP-binding protein [Thalassobacillus hwangdonensis]|uniref:histidine kinase n=1 Tax=Thalassobacillus hwangdonensis TaxID=546108 RepID=A0ABW3L613_9BACI
MMLSESVLESITEDDVLTLTEISGVNACIIYPAMEKVRCNRHMQDVTHMKPEISLDTWVDLFYVYDQLGVRHTLSVNHVQQTSEIKARIFHNQQHQWMNCTFVRLSNNLIAVIMKPADLDETKHIDMGKNELSGDLTDLGKGYPPHWHSSPKTTEKLNARAFEMHRRMKDMAESFPHGLGILNKEWEIIYTNPVMDDIMGRSLKEHYKTKLWDLYPVSEYSAFYQHFYLAFETKQTVTFDAPILRSGIQAKVTAYPTDDGLTVFMQDITKKKMYLKALQESEKRFSLLANNIKDVFWICDEKMSNVIYMSNAFREVFGVENRNQMMRADIWKDLVDNETYTKVKSAFSKMVEEERQIEFKVTTPEGEEKWIRTHGFPVRDGEKHYVVGIHEDITDSKEMESIIRKSEQLSAITQISAGIAHEIKNPLTALKGFMQLGMANPDKIETYYEIMINEINRMEAIVCDFMLLAKPENSIELEDVNIENTISYILELFSTQIEDRKLNVHTRFDMENKHLQTDPKRLKQILINVIKNGLEAVAENGTLDILVKCEGHQASIRIQDDGKGLSEEQLNRLGEPFFTTKEDGTGLGIMVTKKMVSDLNGDIQYNSKVGEGTEVTVLLPSACK